MQRIIGKVQMDFGAEPPALADYVLDLPSAETAVFVRDSDEVCPSLGLHTVSPASGFRESIYAWRTERWDQLEYENQYSVCSLVMIGVVVEVCDSGSEKPCSEP